MPEDRTPSLRALDALNFCNAGIQTGLGPFMSVFYASQRHWNPGQIGALIACQSLAGVGLQSFTGGIVDRSSHKQALTAAAAAMVALCAVGIALIPSFTVQIAIQLTIGIAITVFPAATSAFALGLAEKDQITGRIARNESFTHFGNAAFALAAGLLGALVALAGIFYAAGVFASGMAVAALLIRKHHVNFEAAREGQEDGKQKGIRELLTDRRVLIFTATVVLFNISNQATLPLVAQILSRGSGGDQGQSAKNQSGQSQNGPSGNGQSQRRQQQDGKGQSRQEQGGGNRTSHGAAAAWQIAAAVFVAEAVMMLVALYVGKKANPWGRKPFFLAAFAFLALRNGLSVVSHNPFYLISLQGLDGVAAAIYGVLLTLIAADLARGSGRFNFLQGAIQSAMGLGGFLSNLGFGALAKSAGFNASFLGLAAAAVAGGLLFQWRMPETRPDE